MKVMIIDDDGQIREGIRRAVPWQSLGFSFVECYANGEEALRAFPEVRPDLMICDIEMPKLSGLELGEAVQKYGTDVRIIYLTAFSDFEYARGAMRVGAEDYILKPVKIADLINSVQENVRKLEKLRQKDSRYYYALMQDLAEKIYVLGREGLEKELFSLIQQTTPAFSGDYIQTMLLEINSVDGFESDAFLELEKELKKINCVMLPYRMNQRIFLASSFNSALYNLNYRFQIQSELSDWNSVNSEIGYQLQAGISSAHPGKELKKGLLEAEEALTDSFYNGKAINVYEGKSRKKTVSQGSSQTTRQQLHDLQRLIREAITENDEKKLELRLEQLKNFSGGMHLSQERFLRELMRIYSKVTEQLGLAGDTDQVYETLAGCDTAGECIRIFREYVQRHVYEGHNSLTGPSDQTYSHTIEKAIHYIQEHYPEPLSISRVAEYVGKSDNHFSAIFKKEVGLSFTEYITRLRIEKACQMLRFSTKQVKDICSEVGIPDYLYFSKTFKKVMGCTPSDIRKTI
ncbi:MAG: response regulator [Blautia sp.]|nr:response regulator [Blautia sp.]